MSNVATKNPARPLTWKDAGKVFLDALRTQCPDSLKNVIVQERAIYLMVEEDDLFDAEHAVRDWVVGLPLPLTDNVLGMGVGIVLENSRHLPIVVTPIDEKGEEKARPRKRRRRSLP